MMKYLADTHILLWAIAILEQLQRKPDSTPSDVLKVLCKCLGMLDAERNIAVS